LDWLVLLATFGVLLVIAARRIWGPVGTSAPSGEPLEDASIPHGEGVGSPPEGPMRPPRMLSRRGDAYASRLSRFLCPPGGQIMGRDILRRGAQHGTSGHGRVRVGR
jgi:hypothetical protein